MAFKTILHSNYHINSKLPSVTDAWPFQDHLITKTVILMQSSVSQENCSKLCLPGDLNNKYAESRLPQGHEWMAFPRPSCTWTIILTQSSHMSLMHAWPLQDHLTTKTFILIWSFVYMENSSKLCLPWDLNNACADPRLPQCHQWIALSRPFFHSNYHINLKLSLPRDLNNKWKLTLPQCHQQMAFSIPFYH